MIGIYKITNKINNKSYIGQSKNIEKRFDNHKQRAFVNTENNKEYDKALYRAFRKYGLENFSFEILEECQEKDLLEKEKNWIRELDTFRNGYNETEGGEGVFNQECENHPKTTLTNEDVYKIREEYNNHKDQKEVYLSYKNKIGESGFKKIWNGYTWKQIHYDVYTQENKEYYLYKRNSNSENNSHAKLTENEVRNIRMRRKAGEDKNEVYKDYIQLSKGSFDNIWYNINWKHIVV